MTLQELLTNSGHPFQIHHHAKTILVSIEFKQGKYSEHKCFSDETESGMIKQVEKCLKKNK